MMKVTEKLVKELCVGDKLALDNGDGVVTLVEPTRIFETDPGGGGAYQIEWRDIAGEIGRAIVDGNDCVLIP